MYNSWLLLVGRKWVTVADIKTEEKRRRKKKRVMREVSAPSLR